MHCLRRPAVTALDLQQQAAAASRLKQPSSEALDGDLKNVSSAASSAATVTTALAVGNSGSVPRLVPTKTGHGNGHLSQDLSFTTTAAAAGLGTACATGTGTGIGGRLFSPCTVGRYILLDQLDDRAMYKCVNIDTNEEFTCKIVNNDGNKMLSAHFRVDSHEHINELVEVMVADRHTYLVFGRGYGDLHSYVRARRRLRESEAQRLFAQVADAVLHCHRNGIVLRDLKLRRFVFKDPERSQLKLESLEDAVVMEDEADDDTLDVKHGCPAYVSPEILTPNGSYSGKAADVWSMGVMLYAMLVGRYPFHDTDTNNLFNKIRSGHYTIPDTLSSKAKCLIRSLLRHSPDERLIAEDVLRHPWLRNMTSRSPCDSPSPPPHSSSPPYGSVAKPSASTTDNGRSDQLVPEVVDRLTSSAKHLRQARN